MDNIDDKIREILSRNFPVNDNNKKDIPTDPRLSDMSGISIVGDNNIVIDTGSFGLIAILAGICLLLINL